MAAEAVARPSGSRMNPAALTKLMESLSEFDSQHLAKTAWLCAKAGHREPELFNALALASMERMSEFNSQGIANTAWAFAKARHRSPKFFKVLAVEVTERIDEFNSQDVANIAWAFATARHDAPELFRALAAETMERLSEFKAQGLANIAWAFAKTGHRDPELFRAIALEAMKRIHQFNSQDLANTAWAFAKAGHKAPELFTVLASEATARLRGFNSQQLANTAWAFATAGHRAPILFDALALEAVKRLSKFNAQSLANTVWAFATAGHHVPELFEEVASEATKRLSELNSQNLANTAWAFAKVGHLAPELFEALAMRVTEHMHALNSQNLTNTAWAFATIGHDAPDLFASLALEAMERLSEFNSQEIANTAWAFATAGHHAPKLFEALAHEAVERLGEFSSQNLANMAQAFAKAGHRAPELFTALALEARRRLREFDSQNLANTAWAFATAGHTAPELFSALALEATERVSELNSQHLANIAWAFATAGHDAPDLFTALCLETARRLKQFNSQNLANTAWAFATAGHGAPLLYKALAVEVMERFAEFNSQEVTMTMWALSRGESIADAWALWERVKMEAASQTMSRISFSAALECSVSMIMECEQRGLLGKEVALLQDLIEVASFSDNIHARAFSAVVINAAVVRLLAVGEKEQASQSLYHAVKKGHVNAASASLWAACDGPLCPSLLSKIHDLQVTDIPSGSLYAKELRLLAFVLSTAQMGDAASVCDAMESFGEDVLSAEGQWLKIAGSTKAEVLRVALSQEHADGAVLEIGTYCGYSALRMAMARPNARIVTLEVDAVHMAIARNIVAFAGLSDRIDVWTGHSRDLLHRLPARYGAAGSGLLFSAVFMDQRGSRFHEDLAALEKLGLLPPGALVVADNVLKPGAPFFLWRLLKSNVYDTHIVRLQEFAMPSEDWMSVSVWMGASVEAVSNNMNDDLGRLIPVLVPESPPELIQLQWETDHIRELATRPGHGVSYSRWSAFAERMKGKFAELGIAATIDGKNLATLNQKLAISVAQQLQITAETAKK